jgi:NADH pyrophosphatase NudC (nudix superfamily)
MIAGPTMDGTGAEGSMHADEVERRWAQLAEEVFIGMREWRSAHPRATLTEIEEALDSRLAAVRARMLEDVALRSAAADVQTMAADERPVCPDCGHQLQARGKEQRTLTTQGDQAITLTRSRAACPVCGTGFFPPG